MPQDGLTRPGSEEELADLVRMARARRLPVRVRGTGHSVDEAIFTTARARGAPAAGLDLSLERLSGVSFDEDRLRVTVGGGKRLGPNPRDRSGRSGVETGLCWQLEQRGWALPIVAGVSRQTVAGFLMTGSAGGSRRHALTEQVVALRLVDGTGELRELSRDADGELLDAATVSLGLLGIVTSVTLQCVERFDVEGAEQTVRRDRAPFSALADGEAGLDGFLRRAEYGRAYWWPQPGVDRMTVWSARAAPGPPGVRRPYLQLPEVAGSQVPAQAVAGTLIGAVCRRRRWTRPLTPLYNAFLGEGEPRPFRDSWWRAIPMDDDLDERFFPSTYCELWLPAEATGEAMRRLADHYRRWGFGATGGYTVEIYAAPRSPAWLSPAHGRDSTRFNFCWHLRGRGNPVTDYFPQFLDLLGDLEPRLHWGKHLLADPVRDDPRPVRTYPRLADFLELRDRYDPDGLFLTDYWRGQLGIRKPAAGPLAFPAMSEAAGAGAAARAVGPPGRRWPLLFKLVPSDPSFADEAPHAIDIEIDLQAEPDRVLDAIVNLVDAREWLPDFVRARWVEGPDADGRQTVDETFRFMSQRVRTFRYEPGRRWMASIDACTLPLGRRLLEDVTIEQGDGGHSRLRWLYYYEPVLLLRPFRRLLHGEFERMLRKAVEQLDAHLSEKGAPESAGQAG